MNHQLDIETDKTRVAETAMLVLEHVATDCKDAGLGLLSNLIGAAIMQARQDRKGAAD